MHALLDDPAYRRQFKTIPRLPESLQWGQPWAVWARRVDGGWRGALTATYRDAWGVVVKAVRSPLYEDVSVVSRRMLFDPPADVVWDEVYFSWCFRCRRPSSFIVRPDHHALRGAPARITDPTEPRDRCYYCGMRIVAMPTLR